MRGKERDDDGGVGGTWENRWGSESSEGEGIVVGKEFG